MSGYVDVSGGAGGLEVEYDDLGAAAQVLQTAALDVVDTALDARRAVTDAGMLASALLDPGGFARAEAAVLAAVLGPHGLLAAAARLEERSLALRAAVLRYVAADRLDIGLREVRHWAEGTGMLLALPLLPALAISPLGPVALHWVQSGDAGTVLAEHPGIAEDAAGAAPSFLGGLVSLSGGPALLTALLVTHGGGLTTLEQESALLALAYPAGSARVVARGTDPDAPPPPADVADLVLALLHRDELAHGDAQGEIDVRRLTRIGHDGSAQTSWIVDLPGTKDWQVDPREHRDHLNDLATNLTTMAGGHSARVDGVTRALELAGVGRDEPVMLVGHSQGGLVALRAAEQYAEDGSFHVTHVVTAGAPIARMTVPESVSVLALENPNDLVPQLDGQPSPDQHNRITVLVDTQRHDVGLNHAIATAYLPAARAVDADLSDPSLSAWREGATAFLTPVGATASVRTTVWDIRNAG
jgi:pimeloyl-ACP methyl ester carboxylesterase